MAGPTNSGQVGKRLLPVALPERLVVAQWNSLLKLTDRANLRKAVIAPKTSMLGVSNEPEQNAFLHPSGIEPIELARSPARYDSKGTIGPAADERASEDCFGKRHDSS